MAITVFEDLTSQLHLRRPVQVHYLQPCDFAFRETAFALLFIAAGKFHFEDLGRFLGTTDPKATEGFLINRVHDQDPTLMPLFGTGCRMSDRHPGSAPSSTIYWFENVLISLVPDSVLENDLEIAIARTLGSKLAVSHKILSLVLFTVYHFVLVKVNVDSGVTTFHRSQVQPMLDTCSSQPYLSEKGLAAARNTEEKQQYIAELSKELFCHIHRAFKGLLALQSLFEDAAIVHRSFRPHSLGIFPVEIYAKIIPHADRNTRDVLSQISKELYGLCRKQFPFSQNLTLIDCTLTPHESPHLWRGARWSDWFAIKNEVTGIVGRDSFRDSWKRYGRGTKLEVIWCPVIGTAERPSLLPQVKLRTISSRYHHG